jgi:hypothetical protein
VDRETCKGILIAVVTAIALVSVISAASFARAAEDKGTLNPVTVISTAWRSR